MFQAQQQWNYRYGPFQNRFRYQYVISRADEALDGFTARRLGRLNLYCGQDLPLRDLRDAAGKTVGYVLGIAVGTKAEHGTDALKLPFKSSSTRFWNQFESLLDDAAGRYAFVVQARGQSRLYTDPVGMIGAVYNPEDGYVASSTLLALKRTLRPHPKYDFDVIRNRAGKLTLFHTADEGVHRLNPNMYLDLDTLEPTRFWPRDVRFTPEPSDPTAVYDEIIRTARANIGAIVQDYPCSLPVSGGMDSRLILGFAGDHLGKIGQVYTHINNYATRRDAAIAAELCRVCDVEHEVHDRRDFGIARRDVRLNQHAFELTYGAPAAAPKEYQNGVFQGVTEGNVILRGHQTDLLRAVYVFRPKNEWRDPDWQIERLLVVPRADFTKEVADRFRDDFLAWQATLPEAAMEKAADFMFLEVYSNSSIGTLFPAIWRNFYISPYNSRRLITLSLLFSETSRRASQPVFELIEMMNSDLSQVPFDFEAPASLENIEDWRKGASSTRNRRDQTVERLLRYA
ncbi:MAG: asparagine synthase-related protein [Marivita sp.]|uniref:asparagine synthase-related protein n=1 Tax=Marivita sp. TaxID=2003365 RepID=UPI0025BA96B5|nr:asparagine synthase-related protein [Marivita sp.]MCI5109106.1 asparagine synthase-related protein [Marivita sp.]